MQTAVLYNEHETQSSEWAAEYNITNKIFIKMKTVDATLVFKCQRCSHKHRGSLTKPMVTNDILSLNGKWTLVNVKLLRRKLAKCKVQGSWPKVYSEWNKSFT